MRVRFLVAFLLISILAEARLPDLIPYRKGNLWGYCDSTKKMILEPQWEFTTPFRGNTAVVKKDGKYGLIDQSGKTTTGYIFTSLDEESRNGKRVAALKKKKVGLIDEKGREIIPFQYTRIYWESDKYLRVHDGGINGEIDSSGKIIVPFDYVTTTPEQGYIFGESAKCGYFVFSKWSGTKFGVIDSMGKIVIPLIYHMAFDLGQGYFCMHRYFRINGHISADSEYVFDRTGKLVSWNEVPNSFRTDMKFFPCPYRDSAMNFFYTGWADDMYYRHMVHEERLLFAGNFRQGLAAFMTLDSLCGFVNENFERVIPPKYGWCSDFSPNSLALTYQLHHHFPRKRSREHIRYDYFDVRNRLPNGYIDIHGTEYWED